MIRHLMRVEPGWCEVMKFIVTLEPDDDGMGIVAKLLRAWGPKHHILSSILSHIILSLLLPPPGLRKRFCD